MGIIALMIIMAVGLVFWKRAIKLPRKPDTLGGVMSYLCASQFLTRVNGYNRLDDKEMEKQFTLDQRRYMYGRFEDANGVDRSMIESFN
jgi:hypothetical protein